MIRTLSLLLILLTAGCAEKSTEPTPDLSGTEASFAGSMACAACHPDIHAMWTQTGHPTALIRVNGASPAPRYDELAAYVSDPVPPPMPYSDWDAISYVAGGYGWKMLWINSRGYPVQTLTAGDFALYSFGDRQWKYWGSYAQRDNPANCGGCHATGWVEDEDWATDGDLSDNQDGLEGMSGMFTAPGIHCEECHGLGSRHVAQPEAYDLVVDRTSADCGRCHHKDENNDPLASWGFLTPNSQYDEWLHSGHALGSVAVECVDCHDPHASVKYDGEALGSGTYASCRGCHSEAARTNHHDAFAPTNCVDCHMPYAVKSAYERQYFAADMRTHLVDISVDPVGRVEGMGMIEGTDNIAQDAEGRARITLDLACYGCHADGYGAGGSATPLDLEQLASFAAGIHAR